VTVLAHSERRFRFTTRRSWLERRLGPAWPLKALLLGFPVWWALGFASFAFLIAAIPMALQLVRRRPIAVPAGFGIWLLFLGWMLAGVFMLWVYAPGTVDGGGLERALNFGYRVAWYLAITVAMLYPLSLPSRAVPALQIIRWMAFLFLVAIAGGLAGLLLPTFQFTSLAELAVPGGSNAGFIYQKVHPSLTTLSEFLGYEQPRPKAPFTYANAWGNNVGLLLPFFVLAGIRSTRRWQRILVPVVLALAVIPVAFSLNRGLWLGLCLLMIYGAVVLARSGRYVALWGTAVGAVLAILLLLASPLWDTISLRLDTPHSNDRRTTVAQVVTQTTWDGSPLLGYGTTRQVSGSFFSVAGGGTPECRQCAAPPLGTQGFMWRLVFTTGFVGTALFFAFVAIQFAKHIRRRDAVSIAGCMSLTVACLFFFVYDSLESPLFLLMLGIGLMNRERLEEMWHAATSGAAEQLPLQRTRPRRTERLPTMRAVDEPGEGPCHR
jgi:hypothetical protein